MFVSAVVFKGTLGLKSIINGRSVFKNVLQNPTWRRFTGFRVWNTNSRPFSSSCRRLTSVSRPSRLAEAVEKNYENPSSVLNNVIIFKYDRDRAVMIVFTFVIVQFVGMFAMASNVYNTFCQDLFDPDKSWRTKIWEHKFSLFAISAGCVFAPLIAIFSYLIAARTVRRIILHKGGEKITVDTYHPIPKMRRFTVPLENVSCKNSRTYRGTLALRFKDRRFYYFVDSDGDFPNGDLFDFTAGVKRDF